MNLKFGVISEIDIDNGLARVYFEDDEFVSAPLKISVMRSGPDQFSFPFDIKEHVWCVVDENCEYGVIAGAIYDENNIPDGSAKGRLKLKFADNSTIEYDRESATLSFDIKGKVTINCTEADITCEESAKLKAIETTVDGILNVTGAANIQGVASVGGLSGINGGPVNAGNSAITAKSLQASDDVKAGTVSLKSHVHTSGANGSPTSQPIA